MVKKIDSSAPPYIPKTLDVQRGILRKHGSAEILRNTAVEGQPFRFAQVEVNLRKGPVVLSFGGNNGANEASVQVDKKSGMVGFLSDRTSNMPSPSCSVVLSKDGEMVLVTAGRFRTGDGNMMESTGLGNLPGVGDVNVGDVFVDAIPLINSPEGVRQVHTVLNGGSNIEPGVGQLRSFDGKSQLVYLVMPSNGQSAVFSNRLDAFGYTSGTAVRLTIEGEGDNRVVTVSPTPLDILNKNLGESYSAGRMGPLPPKVPQTTV